MITQPASARLFAERAKRGIQKYPTQIDTISARGIPTKDRGNAKIAASLRPNPNIIRFCTNTIAVEMIAIMNIETHNAEGEMSIRNSVRDLTAAARRLGPSYCTAKADRTIPEARPSSL